VDFARQCYTVDMRFYPDDPTRITKVQWYFPATTQTLPFSTAFYRRAWEKNEWNQEPIGEILGTERWHGSLPPYPIGYGGPCGSPQVWNEGAPLDFPLPAYWPGTTVPVCCPQPPPSPQGGIAVGPVGVVSCLAQNTAAPLFIAWGCVIFGCPGSSGFTVLNPVNFPCSLLPDTAGLCLYQSAPVTIFGVTCQICLVSLFNAFGEDIGVFFQEPGFPCQSATGVPPNYFLPVTVLTCNPFITSGSQFVTWGPCAGFQCSLGTFI
jgi:hypothetical protein